jgi:hypothetical protein
MTLTKPFALAAALLIASSAFAASNKVCMGGNVEQLNAAQTMVCKQQVEQVRAAAARSGASDWHFIVVCDEPGWADYAAFSNTPATQLQAANADTNVAQRTTFVRAGRIASSDMLAVELADIARASKGPTQMASLR